MHGGKIPFPNVPAGFDWEAFRQDGYKTIDAIVDYHKSLQENRAPVVPDVKPNFLAPLLNLPEAPQSPESYQTVLKQVQEAIIPGMTHWQHPNFYAFFPAQVSPPAILGEMMATAVNQPGFNWVASPAATELEVIVGNWVSKALGLPTDLSWEGTGGALMQPSATETAVIVVLAAKVRALQKYATIPEKSEAAGRLVCYVSDQAHFCVEKAAKVNTIWHIRKIKTERDPATGNYPMLGSALKAAVEEDVKSGLIPFFASANYGTTGICATDDFEGIATVCKEHNMWLNIDAAYAGATLVCPDLRAPFAAAAENADSIFVNGSKWFSMSFNATFFFFRSKKDISVSLNATGVYLKNEYTDSNAVVDLKDYQLGLGRPFRALKAFVTLRTLGIEGIQASVYRHIALADYLYEELKKADVFDLPLLPRFGLVCFRCRDDPTNSKTNALEKLINQSREYFLVCTELEGVVVIRVAMAYPALAQSHVDSLKAHILACLAELNAKA